MANSHYYCQQLTLASECGLLSADGVRYMQSSDSLAQSLHALIQQTCPTFILLEHAARTRLTVPTHSYSWLKKIVLARLITHHCWHAAR